MGAYQLRGIHHHFVGLDVVGKQKLGDPEKEMHEQNEKANRRESLYSKTSHSRDDSLGKLKRFSVALKSMDELVQEKGEHQNSKKRAQVDARQSETDIKVLQKIKIINGFLVGYKMSHHLK